MRIQHIIVYCTLDEMKKYETRTVECQQYHQQHKRMATTQKKKREEKNIYMKRQKQNFAIKHIGLEKKMYIKDNQNTEKKLGADECIHICMVNVYTSSM